MPPNEHLVGRVAAPVPAGALRYRLAIQQGDDAGTTLPTDSVRVGPTSATALSLSDLVLGSRTANLGWRRTPDDTVLFNPLRTYKWGEEMELYYEIEGLRPAPYTVELAVKRRGSGGGVFKKIFGGGSAAIKLKFEQQATTGAVTTHRSLKLDRLKPGRYVLELSVVDADGRKDTRSQEFQVVDEEKRS